MSEQILTANGKPVTEEQAKVAEALIDDLLSNPVKLIDHIESLPPSVKAPMFIFLLEALKRFVAAEGEMTAGVANRTSDLYNLIAITLRERALREAIEASKELH